MRTTEEQRQILGSFETPGEALREARIYSQMSHLATRLVTEDRGCLVVVENSGPVPSSEWLSYVPYEFQDDDEGDTTFLESGRDFLLGRSPDGDHLPSRKFYRIFTENLKHPEHFLERIKSSQYLLMVETFNIGNRKCRKLLDLGRLTTFALYHMSGATPSTAFLSALYALRIADVRLDLREINLGSVQNVRTGQTLFKVDDELIAHAIAISEHQLDQIELYETYRGAFYELRRRDWSGFVFFNGYNWATACSSISPERRSYQHKKSSTLPTEIVAVEEFAQFSQAQQSARVLVSKNNDSAIVRRTEAGWIVLVSAYVSSTLEKTNDLVAGGDFEQPDDDPQENEDEFEREMDELRAELEDDWESYARSQDDGWYYSE